MMKRVDQFREAFNDAVEDVERYAIFVRARELQESSIATLSKLLDECTERKNAAIEEDLNDEANAYLAFEFMARALIEEFRFYLALKEDKVSTAWDHLINAESSAASAMKSHNVASHLESYIRRLHALERLLFPQPMFFSSGWVVHRSECSICGAEYGECDHIKGRAYMGKLCARVIREGELREFSVVSDPADKHCRALHFTEGEVTRDAFTHRIVAGGEEEIDKVSEKIISPTAQELP